MTGFGLFGHAVPPTALQGILGECGALPADGTAHSMPRATGWERVETPRNRDFAGPHVSLNRVPESLEQPVRLRPADSPGAAGLTFPPSAGGGSRRGLAEGLFIRRVSRGRESSGPWWNDPWHGPWALSAFPQRPSGVPEGERRSARRRLLRRGCTNPDPQRVKPRPPDRLRAGVNPSRYVERLLIGQGGRRRSTFGAGRGPIRSRSTSRSSGRPASCARGRRAVHPPLLRLGRGCESSSRLREAGYEVVVPRRGRGEGDLGRGGCRRAP